nr:DegT/DnrJ/EryC1/StrS family aminotransferase [Brooklawnia cerclae]
MQERIPRWPRQTGDEQGLLAEILATEAWGSSAGHFVHDFEDAFAAYHDAPHALACANGTIALISALSVLDLPFGSEVIVPSYTFIATAAAPAFLGLVPVFCDTLPGRYTMDPGALAQLVGPRTSAIVPVHLGGAPCEMDEIMAVARGAGVPVIEDAAQAAGIRYKGRAIPVGDMATFSFQSSKNLASGEGGAIVTRDDELASRLFSFVNVGRVPGGAWYDHRTFGMNLRLSEFQGAILREQLKAHPELQKVRRDNAERLAAALAGVDGIEVPPVMFDDGSTHGQHLFLMRFPTLTADRRDELAGLLHAAGLTGASTGYVPLHRNPALLGQVAKVCEALGRSVPEAHCPNTDRLVDETIWLPQTVLLADPEVVDAVADIVVTAFREVSGGASS